VVCTGTEAIGGHSPRTPWYTITDVGGDVVALVEITEPGTEAAQAHVAAQWTYDAYGNVQSADFIRPHPQIAVGHKGLFADRLDVPLTDFMAETEHPVLVPYSRIHYHTRNRVLDPTLGRWLQRDPNATGQCVIESLAHHGRQAEVQMSDAGLLAHMQDGLNTYEYVRSAPLTLDDPLGLMTSAMEVNLSIGTLTGMFSAKAGTAGVVTSMSVLFNNPIAWILGTSGTGAIVASGNYHALVSGFSHVDANWNHWFELSSDAGQGGSDGWGGTGGGGGSQSPKPDKKWMTNSQEQLAKDWKVSKDDIGRAIHE
jgi:hypothetical protein